MFKYFKCVNTIATVSFILLFVMGIPSFSYNNMAVARDLNTQIDVLKDLPEAKSLNSDMNMNLIEFYPDEMSEQDSIVFIKSKIYELNDSIMGYMYNNQEDIGKSYGYLIAQINIIDRIPKDVPELKDRANAIKQKLNLIYGPAVQQILYFFGNIGDYKDMLPNEILKATESELIKLANENPEIKVSVPYLFGKKYEKESSSMMLNNVEVAISEKNMALALCELLCFHPKVLSCDSDYIVNRLSWKIDYDFLIDEKPLHFEIKLPKHWGIQPKPDKDDFTLFLLNCPLDNFSATYRQFAYINGVEGDNPKDFLENLKKEEDIIKVILNDSNVKINKINIEKLANDDIMTLDYQYPNMKDDKSGLYRTYRSYVFLLDKRVFAFNYSVGAINQKDCEKALNRNIPLFEKLVKATIDSYIQKKD